MTKKKVKLHEGWGTDDVTSYSNGYTLWTRTQSAPYGEPRYWLYRTPAELEGRDDRVIALAIRGQEPVAKLGSAEEAFIVMRQLAQQDVAEAHVIGHVSDVAGHGKVVQCDKCGTDIRDDHGYALSNSTYICRDGQKCSMRQSKNKLAALAAQGKKPRWRKDEGVAEMDKSQTPPGRSGANPDAGKEYTAKPIKAKNFAKYASDQWIKNLSKDQLDAIAGPRYKKKGVAEGFNGISVDVEPELDYDVVYVDINGKKYSFNYWHSDEKPTDELGFRKDIPQYLKREEWYNRLDQPTKMEVLHAIVQAELGNEPSEYNPTVGDEPLDERGVTEGFADELAAFAKERGGVLRYGPQAKKPAAVTTAHAAPAAVDRSALAAELKQLQAEFDPRYQYSDDHSFWSKQHDIAQRIAYIKKQLSTAEQGVAEAVNAKQIKKDLDSGMSVDAVIGKHANKRTTNTDEIRKVIQQHAWEKRMKPDAKEQGVAEGQLDFYKLDRLDPQTRRVLTRMADHKEPGSWLSASEAYALTLGLQYKNRNPRGWEQEVQHYVDLYRQYSGQGVAEGSAGVIVRKWANQVRKDHGSDIKFWNRKEGGGAVDSVVARNSQGETVGVYNRKTGYPTVFEPKQGVAEDAFAGINITMDKEDDEITVRADAGGRHLGHVLFVIDDGYLMPQDLEVDERFRGQGIAAAMYDYVKSQGYKIRRSGQQTDAGAAFWDKHRPGKNVWEQGVSESDPSGLLSAAKTMNRSFIITADLAEGGRKQYRVRAQSERVAREKFAQHANQAKIVSVEEEFKESVGEAIKFVDGADPEGHSFGAGAVRHDLSNIKSQDTAVGRDMPVADIDPEWEFEQRLQQMIRDIASSSAAPEHKTAAINALIKQHGKSK
jgi:hypothetical protein